MIGLENNNGYDFFGVKRKKVGFSYLGGTQMRVMPKSTLKLNVVNFIGTPTSTALGMKAYPKTNKSFKYWERNKPLYRKESTRQKHLSKWGDADMDGSPNYFDCDPVDWLKDKKKVNSKKVNEFTTGNAMPKFSGTAEEQRNQMAQYVKLREDAAAAKSSKNDKGSAGQSIGKKKSRKSLEMKQIKSRQVAEERLRGMITRKSTLMKSPKVAEAEEAFETSIAKGKVPKGKILKLLAESRRRQIVTRAAPRAKTKKEMEIEKKIAKTEEAQYISAEEIGQMKPGKRKRYYAELPRKELKAAKERQKQYKALRSEERKIAEEAYISRVQPFRVRALAAKEGAVKAAKAVFTREGREKLYEGTTEKIQTIGKQLKTAEGRKELGREVMRGAEGVAAATAEQLRKVELHPEAVIERGKAIAKGVPQAMRATYGKEERAATQKVRRLVKGGLGGLFGASLTQTRFGPAIRGRPSGPSGKYMIEGKPVFEEEYQKWAAQQRAMNRLTPSTQQQAPLTPEEQQVAPPVTEQGYPTETNPMSAGEIEATKTMESVQRGPTSAELLAAQELAQQQDNILNAPSFMKGELKATGGSLLTATGPQIMDAPNAFKGQLRNLSGNKEIPAVRLSERPQTNPYGDEYIDIELGSGKPVLKKRPREKWMTGEAL